MAASSMDSPSPANLQNKESTSFMGSSPLFSPSSDKRFWSTLRCRIDNLLENRNPELLMDLSLPTQTIIAESDRSKRLKVDSLLLLRGFDSVAHTLSELSNNLDTALQGARDLAKPPTLTELLHNNLEKVEIKADLQKKEQKEDTKIGFKRKSNSTECSEDEGEEDPHKKNDQVTQNAKLKKAKNLAISMAAKAASLRRELKSLKSDLSFVQERCTLIEEENKRLRIGFAERIIPEEDDLVRLQLEALLAEKSRLANENATLTRENQSLRQLVEYHQFTSQDLSASYEDFIQGMCLDFSSPSPTKAERHEDSIENCSQEEP